MTVRQQLAEPTAAELEQQLGRSHAAFRELLAEAATLRPEWKYYGPKIGWTLKLFEKKRNLCFVSPKAKHFDVAFLFGERAAESVLASAAVPEPVKDELRNARRYVEGRAVRVTVAGRKDLATVRALLALKRG